MSRTCAKHAAPPGSIPPRSGKFGRWGWCVNPSVSVSGGGIEAPNPVVSHSRGRGTPSEAGRKVSGPTWLTICTAVAPEAVPIVRMYGATGPGFVRISAHIFASGSAKPQVRSPHRQKDLDREPSQVYGWATTCCTFFKSRPARPGRRARPRPARRFCLRPSGAGGAARTCRPGTDSEARTEDRRALPPFPGPPSKGGLALVIR
jgi:hypothetical protein